MFVLCAQWYVLACPSAADWGLRCRGSDSKVWRLCCQPVLIFVAEMRALMCVLMCVGTCIDMCVEAYAGVCMDACTSMSMPAGIGLWPSML